VLEKKKTQLTIRIFFSPLQKMSRFPQQPQQPPLFFQQQQGYPQQQQLPQQQQQQGVYLQQLPQPPQYPVYAGYQQQQQQQQQVAIMVPLPQQQQPTHYSSRSFMGETTDIDTDQFGNRRVATKGFMPGESEVVTMHPDGSSEVIKTDMMGRRTEIHRNVFGQQQQKIETDMFGRTTVAFEMPDQFPGHPHHQLGGGIHQHRRV